jgi:hypothetical protein
MQDGSCCCDRGKGGVEGVKELGSSKLGDGTKGNFGDGGGDAFRSSGYESNMSNGFSNIAAKELSISTIFSIVAAW